MLERPSPGRLPSRSAITPSVGHGRHRRPAPARPEPPGDPAHPSMLKDHLLTYARNGGDFHRLRSPYRAFMTVTLWIGLALTLAFLWWVGRALGAHLGIDFHAAIEPDARTLSFVVPMLVMAPVSMLAICTGVVWVSTFVFRWKGWMSRTQALRLVTHSEYPAAWLRSVQVRLRP